MKNHALKISCLMLALALAILTALPFRAPAALASAAEETPAEAQEPAENENAEEAAADAKEGGVPFGFNQEAQTLIPGLEEILNRASKWNKKSAPKTMGELPALPDVQAVHGWLNGRTATLEKDGGAALVRVELAENMTAQDTATLYFRDMSTLKAVRNADGAYAAQDAGNAEAAFWMIALNGEQTKVTTDAGVWTFGAEVQLASSELAGPAGGTDQADLTVRFDAKDSEDLPRTIHFIIRPGTLTVDIYYGKSSESCRELMYDIRTGELLSSDSW